MKGRMKMYALLLGLLASPWSGEAFGEVAPKKYYRDMLNEYCATYLYGCFDGVYYEDNNLQVSKAREIDASHVFVEGFLTYEDAMGKKQRSVPFTATVETENTEVQRITFNLQKKADMSHTSAYWITCERLFGKAQEAALAKEAREREIEWERARKVQAKARQQEMIKTYTRLLENFAVKYYSTCFTGRTYVDGSLKVEELMEHDNGYVLVKGKHTYIGRWGSVYRDYRFEAKLIEVDGQTKVVFNKESAPDLLHNSPYWEQCTKVF